jgi:hypothetical protein
MAIMAAPYRFNHLQTHTLTCLLIAVRQLTIASGVTLLFPKNFSAKKNAKLITALLQQNIFFTMEILL